MVRVLLLSAAIFCLLCKLFELLVSKVLIPSDNNEISPW